MIPAKIYTLVAPANGMVELPVVGDFFKVLSASGAFTVYGDTFGGVGAILAGQGLRDAPFTKLQFTDTSGDANTIRVLVAGQSFIDDRVTGEVSVVDGGKARTMAGRAFAMTSMLSASPGNYSMTYLYNPAAALVRAVFNRIAISASVAQNIFVSYGTGVPPGVLGAYGIPKYVKNPGLANAVLQKADVQAATFPTDALLVHLLPANQSFDVPLTEPLVIAPNTWIAVTTSVVNSALTFSAQFWEEVIQ
jgi:hypothetical protein